MIYAKCIRKSQIARGKEEFDLRQDEEYSVYCVGETTKSKNGEALGCVPLNCIYDCLRYGDYIAIINTDGVNILPDYPMASNITKVTLESLSQKVDKIINAHSKDAIDFVFAEVKNPALIHYGYIYFLEPELRKYFEDLLSGSM